MVIFYLMLCLKIIRCKTSNDIWCFDLVTCTWRTQETSEPKPLARYGQSQIVLDDDHLIILGGCGGVPNTVLNDVWLLEITSDVWKWHQLNINNSQWAAPHLWCHPACKIRDKVVVFSRNPLSSVPRFAYSRWSPSHPRGQAPVVSDEPENGQRLRRHLSINIKGKMTVKVDHAVDQQYKDADVNINGRGGSVASAEAGPSTGHLETIRAQSTNNIQVRSGKEPHVHDVLLGNANDSEVRGGRLSTESNKNLVPISIHADEFVPMAMFVMDISHVLSDHQVSWLPLKSVPDGSPEDTILFTLVVGNGELIMFGGIQIDATSMTLNIQSSMNISNTVSNELHFITAPTNII